MKSADVVKVLVGALLGALGAWGVIPAPPERPPAPECPACEVAPAPAETVPVTP